MSVWYATEGDGVPWVVIQAEGEDGHGMHHAIAECGTKASAEMIARALNAQGAVEALAELLRIKEGPHDADRIGDATRAWAEARSIVNRPGGQ